MIRKFITIYLKYLEGVLAWRELHARQYREIFIPGFLNYVRSFDNVPAHLKGLEFEFFHNYKFRAVMCLLSYELYAIRYDSYLKDLRLFATYIREQCEMLLRL